MNRVLFILSARFGFSLTCCCQKVTMGYTLGGTGGRGRGRCGAGMGAVLQTYYRKRSPTDSGFQALQSGGRPSRSLMAPHRDGS